MSRSNPAIWAARIYLIVLLVINLSVLLWANCESFQIHQNYNKSLSEQEKVQESTAPSVENDFFAEIIEEAREDLKPLMQAGEIAKTATPIFVVGVFASLLSTTLMIYPKYCMDSIVKHLHLFDMDFEEIDSFWKIAIVCNIALLVFDIIGAMGYWDFAKAFIG